MGRAYPLCRSLAQNTARPVLGFIVDAPNLFRPVSAGMVVRRCERAVKDGSVPSRRLRRRQLYRRLVRQRMAAFVTPFCKEYSITACRNRIVCVILSYSQRMGRRLPFGFVSATQP